MVSVQEVLKSHTECLQEYAFSGMSKYCLVYVHASDSVMYNS